MGYELKFFLKIIVNSQKKKETGMKRKTERKRAKGKKYAIKYWKKMLMTQKTRLSKDRISADAAYYIFHHRSGLIVFANFPTRVSLSLSPFFPSLCLFLSLLLAARASHLRYLSHKLTRMKIRRFHYT